MPRPEAAEIRAIAAAIGVAVDDVAVDRLAAFVALLQRWSAIFNLTAVREPAAILKLHVADCMAVVPALRRRLGGAPARLLDVGSGAGLPGVVIAVLCPEVGVTCVDAVAKKAAFIRQTAAELALPTLHAEHGRVEDGAGVFDVVASRAFSSLAGFCRLSRSRLAPTGVWMAMKGKVPEEEIAALGAETEVFHVEPITVPGLNADRCLIWMRRAA